MFSVFVICMICCLIVFGGLMLSMSNYSAIYSNIENKYYFNGFGPSQNGCSKSCLKIMFKWSTPFKQQF